MRVYGALMWQLGGVVGSEETKVTVAEVEEALGADLPAGIRDAESLTLAIRMADEIVGLIELADEDELAAQGGAFTTAGLPRNAIVKSLLNTQAELWRKNKNHGDVNSANKAKVKPKLVYGSDDAMVGHRILLNTLMVAYQFTRFARGGNPGRFGWDAVKWRKSSAKGEAGSLLRDQQ